MRGRTKTQSSLLTLLSPESVVPKTHPIRRIKALTDRVLTGMNETFDKMYAEGGRASIPPEQLVRAQLLMAFFTVRSERQLCEQLRYNLLFRWFLDMDMDGEVFDASTFSKNRERFIKHDVAQTLLTRIVDLAREEGLLSNEHFTVDGTLLEAWASMKSVRPIGETACTTGKNPDVNFRGEERRNDTHASTTDPDAKLARKSNGTTTKLCFLGNALTENRSGLVVGCCVGPAAQGGTERDFALMLLAQAVTGARATVGGDRGYDSKQFVKEARSLGFTPHVAQKARYSSINGRTTRHTGYVTSQRLRKRIEEVFGWAKTIGGMRKVRGRGIANANHRFSTVLCAYDLIRIAKILGGRKAGVA